MERVDAIRYPHLSLHGSVQRPLDLPTYTHPGCFIPLLDWLRPYVVLLSKAGLLTETECVGFDTAQLVKLSAPLRDGN